jgi:hypothetical protein
VAGRKLKVFQAQFGFYDTVVAAPSQAAALRAWGTHQNLFAGGQARITDDPQAVQAALAHPETPLKRAVGSKEPFGLEATSLPTVPDTPKKKPVGKATAKAPAKPEPSPQPPADRSKLDAAEKALGELDDRRKREEADLRREAEELEARRMAAQSAYVQARKAATSKVVEARTAYRKAGGEH